MYSARNVKPESELKPFIMITFLGHRAFSLENGIPKDLFYLYIGDNVLHRNL